MKTNRIRVGTHIKLRAVLAILALLPALAAAALCGCGGGAQQRSELILATTTSTQDSGLLDQWVPMFESENPYSVKVIAVGSGAALDMARNGEADVLLVHSPKAEEELVKEGYAIERKSVMHNDFVIVGPPGDPSGIKGITSAADAFLRISDSRAAFISRGDNSGTHSKEKKVWEAALGTEKPVGEWYVEGGKGMGDTLRIADEKRAYTLTDRGTYLALKGELELEIMVEGDPILFNNYSVMVVNPEKWPGVNLEGARAFAEFTVSAEAQEFLNVFGTERYGEQLFYPDAVK
jgi:tungstate transport system substrate-binding protein